ncbi:hypothetical protein G7054_g4673 [Neopestalotiopsis clavispora]|nr:hypothetical protein G7054_g4673 [Neopestalotiopsis clavispora]
MPFTETIEFRSDTFRHEVGTYSTQQLRLIEKAATRKCLSSSFSVGSGAVAAVHTAGLTLPLTAYKARSAYVAGRKLLIVGDELQRRGEALRETTFSDVLLGIGPCVVTTAIGFDAIFGGATGVEGVGEVLHLPGTESHGLFGNTSAVVDGFTGQGEQLVNHVIDGTPASQQICEALQSADPAAYHAGMVQANIIEAQIAGEVVEALLQQPIEEPPACRRAVQASFFWDLAECDLCKSRIEQGPYWHCCSCHDDNWDICTTCYEAGKRCLNTGHTMKWLQAPSVQAFIDLMAKSPGYEFWKPPANAVISRCDLLMDNRAMFECNGCAKKVRQGKCFLIVRGHRIQSHVSASNANDLRIKEHSITVVLVKMSRARITTISAMDATSSDEDCWARLFSKFTSRIDCFIERHRISNIMWNKEGGEWTSPAETPHCRGGGDGYAIGVVGKTPGLRQMHDWVFTQLQKSRRAHASSVKFLMNPQQKFNLFLYCVCRQEQSKMDPLSMSASIAGLVSLADVVFRTGAKYVRAVRESKKEVEELLQEVKSLSLLLHSLSLTAFDLEIEAADSKNDDERLSSNLKPHHLHDCQQLLRRLEQSLATAQKDFGSSFGVVRLQRRMKWPFSSEETKSILEGLQRHKQTINVALASDSMANMKLCLSRQEKLNDNVKDIKLIATQILDIETKISMGQKRRVVLDFFTNFDPRPEFEMSKKLRHPLTSLWLTEGPEFDTWYNTPCSGIWCSGMPGAGKSIIAGAMISECLSRNSTDAQLAVAYVFCTYRDSRTHDSAAILSTLAAQLAQQGESAYDILEAYYNELHPNSSLGEKPTADALIGILNKICSTYSRAYLVVDGLDECGSQTRANIRYLMQLAQTQNQKTINMALLSRDELIIRQQLEGFFQFIHLEAHDEDIQLYVAAELDRRIDTRELRLRDISLKDHIFTTLVSGAKGMFRWVACQLDHICELPTDRSRREALSKLPPTLFDTYERILLGIQSQETETQVLVQRSLRIISSRFSTRLTVRAMCEAVSVSEEMDTLNDEDVVDEAEILHWCGSLVRKSNDGQEIEFSHYTVQEYLKSICPTHPRLSAFGTSADQVNDLIGSICLRFLTLKNFEQLPLVNENGTNNILDIQGRHPFYKMAATEWPNFVCRRARGPCAHELSALFNVDKTANFCLWAIVLIVHSVERAEEWSRRAAGLTFLRLKEAGDIISGVLRTDFTPLHMAAVLGLVDICSKLLQQGSDVNTRSQFGTPLHGAIGHFTIFALPDGLWQYEFPQPCYSFLSTARRRTTVLLLEAGAQTERYLSTPYQRTSVMSLPVFASSYGEGLEIVADLAKTGITLNEDDLEIFKNFYRHARKNITPHKFREKPQRAEAFTDLLGAFAVSHAAGSPSSRLYAMTLSFVKDMGLDLPLLRERNTPVEILERYNADEKYSYLHSVIEKNDEQTLNMILRSNQSALIPALRSKSHPGWTCFHIAVHYRALNVLELLLKQGLDSGIPGADGKTPVGLCWRDGSEDILRAFLRHNCSTIIPDNDGRTIWHYSARQDNDLILQTLIELDDRDTALQMKSRRGMTPVYEALDRGHEKSTLLLLPFCKARSFWPSELPVFFAAAKTGSSKVLEKLLEIGVPLDVVDDVKGSPLHNVKNSISLECIQVLMRLFPIDQRRQMDSRTPFELMLIRSSEGDSLLRTDVFEALLAHTLASKPSEVDLLWSLVCSYIIPDVRKSRYIWEIWGEGLVSSMIQKGVTKLYEETRKSCSILPFLSVSIENLGDGVSRSEAMLRAESSGPLPKLSSWDWISTVFREIAQETELFQEIVKDSGVIRLLKESIIHNDGTMLSFLLEKGVDVHEKEHGISPFELACFPQFDLSIHDFEEVLKYSNIQKASQGNEFFCGRGPLHLTAGFLKAQGSVRKLERLVRFGLNCNFPTDTAGRPPLLYHIEKGSLNTAETLLDNGADPWIADENGCDAPLTAAYRGHSSLLKKILEKHDTARRTPNWERNFKKVSQNGVHYSDGNALHISMFSGNLDCLRFYLDNKLICNIESVDKSLETPMHYAARLDQPHAIKVLSEYGANISPADRDGMTPLHTAAEEGQPRVVKVLIELGAEIKACSVGCTPLHYAYKSGFREVIKALQNYEGCVDQKTRKVSHPKAARLMSTTMVRAIESGDLDVCAGLLRAGCSVDIALGSPRSVTPLMLTICMNESPSIAQHLLEMGATVSTVYNPPYRGQFFTILEAALANGCNDILPALLKRYFEEAPSPHNAPRSPLQIALKHQNFDGFKVLLDFVQQAQQTRKPSKQVPLLETTISALHTTKRRKLPKQSALDASAHTFVLDDAIWSPSDLMSQRDQLSDNSTPLHWAAELGHVAAVRALIEVTNAIDDQDVHKRTALHRAALTGSTEVVKLLLNHGSRIDALMVTGDTPLMAACLNSEWNAASFLLDKSSKSCMSRTSYLGDNPLSCIAAATDSQGIQLFHKVVDLGLDLYESRYDGISTAYRLLLVPSHNCLRSLLGRHHRFLAPDRISSPSYWPGSVSYSNLPYVAKALRLLTRCDYTAEELRNIVGLATTTSDYSEKHNLICQAVRMGYIDALRDFGIVWGPSIYNVRCCDHGTPLDTAIACRLLEAVKFLVRDCAVEVSLGGTVHTIAPYDQGIEVPILRWLLVERHTDQPKLTPDGADPSCGMEDEIQSQLHEHTTDPAIQDRVDCEALEPTKARQTQNSRLVHTVELRLPSEWRKHEYESTWEYALRRRNFLLHIRSRQ